MRALIRDCGRQKKDAACVLAKQDQSCRTCPCTGSYRCSGLLNSRRTESLVGFLGCELTSRYRCELKFTACVPSASSQLPLPHTHSCKTRTTYISAACVSRHNRHVSEPGLPRVHPVAQQLARRELQPDRADDVEIQQHPVAGNRLGGRGQCLLRPLLFRKSAEESNLTGQRPRWLCVLQSANTT